MLKTLVLLSIFSFCLVAADAEPSVATQLYELNRSTATSKAAKAYAAYQKELDAANKEVVKSLEAVKADMNGVKKYNYLTIQQKADAIEELDAKIAEIKKGSIGDWIVKSSTLNGEVDLGKSIFGTWKYTIGPKEYTVQIDDVITNTTDGNTATYTISKNVLTVVWKNGITHTLTSKKNDEWVGLEGSRTVKITKP